MFLTVFEKNECRKTDRLLWDYAAMTLREPDMEQVEAHIGRCRACAKKAEEYAALVGVVKTGRIVRMPESQASWQSLRATLEMERRDNIQRRPARGIPFYAFGSLAVAALLVVVFANRIAPSSDWPPPNPKSINDQPPVHPNDPNPSEPTLPNNIGSDTSSPTVAPLPGKRIARNESSPPRKGGQNKAETKSNSFEPQTSPEPKSAAQVAHFVPGDQADRPFDGAQQKDYVLTPVRMGNSPDRGAHFVMGTIPRSEGGITTANYTKAVEESPVW